MAGNAINAKLLEIQRELKVEKSHFSEAYGGFSYRNMEDILEAAKPLCHELGCTVTCDDEVRMIGNEWVYVVTRARLTDVDSGEYEERHGWAREVEEKAKTDPSQITGAASSYAGKRALGNLFALDSSADADGQGAKQEPPANGPFFARCRSCGTRVQFFAPDQMRTFRCCPSPDFEVE